MLRQIKCIICFLMIITVITVSIASCASDENNNDSDPTTNNLIDDVDSGDKVTIDTSSVYYKPSTGYKVGLRYYSFYREKKITITVYMSQSIKDNEELDGYPVFEVYQNMENNIATENRKVIINGKKNKYTEKFKLDDLDYLGDATGSEDVFNMHSETITLNFKDYKVGDTAQIAFSYGFFYYHNNPYNSSQKDNSWCGSRRFLSFYFGENGISVSSNTIEEAIGEYDEYNENIHEIGHNLPVIPGIYYSSKDFYLKPYTTDVISRTHGEEFTEQFSVISFDANKKYTVEISCGDGVKLTGKKSYTTDSDIIKINYRLNACKPFATISIKIKSTENNVLYSTTIYCTSNGSTDYACVGNLSSLSAYSEELKLYLEELNQVGESCDILKSLRYIPSIDVHGYIYWTDSTGSIHPARNITVDICATNSDVYSGWTLDTVTTNDLGYYSADIPTNGAEENIYIKIISKGLNITVNDSSNREYKYYSNIYYALSDGDSINISYTASEETDIGMALSVHQALELANRYMYSLENAYMNNITVLFSSNLFGTTCYNGYDNKIYVIREDAFDWDVLEHEYGHYVAHEFGLLAGVSGIHSEDDILAETLGKTLGIQLAWDEGWATYFAINLQNKMNASAMNIPNVGDTYYTDTIDSTANFDIETVEADYLLGESGEVTIAGILYDITDQRNLNDYDEIYYSNFDVWNIIKSAQCRTLSSFIDALYASSFSTSEKLKTGVTLSHFKVSAYLNTTVLGINSDRPVFSWTKQGGGTNYQNNSFRLAFYDSSYNLILKTSYVNSTSQRLTVMQWSQISQSDDIVYCCVETRQTYTPITGPYNSNLISVIIP